MGKPPIASGIMGRILFSAMGSAMLVRMAAVMRMDRNCR